MQKFKMMQNAVTFISDLTVEEIKLLQRQCPNSLAISEPTAEGYVEEIFRLSHKITAFGDINDNYVTFVDATAEGKACLTVLIPANEPDKGAYLYNKYATAINFIRAIERNARKALANLTVDKETFAKEFIDLDAEVTLTEALQEADIIVAAPTVAKAKAKPGRPKGGNK